MCITPAAQFAAQQSSGVTHLLRGNQINLGSFSQLVDVFSAFSHDSGDSRVRVEQVHRSVALQRQHGIERELVVSQAGVFEIGVLHCAVPQRRCRVCDFRL